MSDYGYRPAPPPEDGRPQGRGAGQPDGRAYGNSPAGPRGGSGDPDYGWGGGSQPQGGGQGQAPRPRQQPYGTPSSGQAPVGRGSASVGGAPAGRGSASVGRPTGSASVGGPGATGSASVGGPGRASVGGPGRASVGSASVGSVSVGSASVGGARPGDPNETTGRASVTGARRAGKGPLNKDDLEGKGGKKKRKRLGRKMLATFIALGVLFVAMVTSVGAYFLNDVPPLSGIAQAGESSSFYYADDETQVGAYGTTLRLQAKEDEIPETVTDALVSLEDRKFWDHHGVNVGRTMAALVNNLTGGETQGASTITQQYAGMVLNARNEISYDRKAREAATAIQMENKYTKKEIITAYLNMAYFGRGAYGIEAAAKNYFNVPLKDLDYDQAAFIVMQVKSPNGYYDPYFEADGIYDEAATQERWDHAMQAMVDTGDLSQAERDAYEIPTPIDEFKASGSWGGDTDLGFIINEQDGYVFQELEDRYGITRDMLKGADPDKDQNGGYKVVLTIDESIQASLKSTGSRGDIALSQDENGNYLDAEGDPVESIEDAAPAEGEDGYAEFINDNPDAALDKYKKYMMSAMVAVNPENGEILGYYGGDDGFGVDKAGAESPHPPSSTMKMVTAATAIEEGDSVNSWFNAGSPRDFESLKLEDSETCIGSGEYPNCTLRNGSQADPDLELQLFDAVRDSKNTPMYSIAEEYGSNSILTNAGQMGLQTMSQTRQIEDDTGEPHDVLVNYRLTTDGNDVFYTQYGKSVDAEGKNVVDEMGNWEDWAPITVNDDCQPIVNTQGLFLEDPNGTGTQCPIGGNGNDKTDPFFYHLAFGQYPTSVRDMASIYATIANDGYYHQSHFVAKVYDNTGKEVQPVNELSEGQALDKKIAQDLQWIGSEIKGESKVGEDLERDFFGKTGTWEASGEDENGEKYPAGYNAHAWYVGAIPQLSIAAWVGNLSSESDPIANPDGGFEGVTGGNTAYPVWLTAMERILDAKGDSEHWQAKEWEGKGNAGNESTWDLEKAGWNPDGEYCQANPEDTAHCGGGQEEQEQEDCEAEGGTWENDACTPADEDPGDDATPTDEPTDETTDEECPVLQPDCHEETTDPEEGATTPDDGERNNG